MLAIWKSLWYYSLRSQEHLRQVGVDSGEGPPVPIPNTEVKLTCAENTWLEAAWEDRKSPTQKLPDGKTSGNRYSSIAQSVEHLTVNQGVTGSSPVGGAKKKHTPKGVCFFLAFFLCLDNYSLLTNQPLHRLSVAKSVGSSPTAACGG